MTGQDVFSQQEVDHLLTKNEAELTELLTLRVNALNKDMSLILQPTFEVAVSPFEALTIPPWIKNTVDAMIHTALRQSHSVLCSSLPEFKEVRNKLMAAIGLSGTTAVIALAAFLTGTLGIAAALATVLATIVLKKIGEPALKAGHETLCSELEKMLPE